MPLLKKSPKRLESESPKRLCNITALLLVYQSAKKELQISLVKSMTSDSTFDPMSLASACATAFSSIEKAFTAKSSSFIWSEKYKVKVLLNAKKITTDEIRLQKRGGYLNLPFI